jgi:hypothetical protein
MATKPVKVLTDLLTKKQIIKQDLDGNILFNVSGVLGNGHVSSSLPVTASYFVGDGRYLTNISSSAGISSVYTSGSITGSGLLINPVTLKDPLIIGTVTASLGFSGNLYGTASLATSASYAATASYILNAVSSSYAFTASVATSASYATNALTASAVTDGATTSIQNAYNRLRYQTIGNFDATGSAIIMLPSSSLGGYAFPTGSFNYIDVRVSIKEDDRWINDLLSVQIYTSSTNVYIELSAPALTSTDQYKLLAVNENPSDYVL